MKKIIVIATLIVGFTSGTSLYAQGGGTEVGVEAPKSTDFMYVSTVKVKADKIVAFKQLLLPYAADTRNERDATGELNAIAYIVHQSPNDSQDFVVYEHWKSDAARADHMNQQHTKDFFTASAPLYVETYPLRTRLVELK